MKKYISVLLAFLLAFSPLTVAYAGNEANDVTLSMYCNLSDKKTVNGKYMDNVFYVSVETLCDLADATVTEQSNKEVFISMERSSRECKINFKSQVMIDSLCKEQNITMPSFVSGGTVYISALHFLRYFGADVQLEDDCSPQFIVLFRYNIFDAVAEYVDLDKGNFFWWDEVDCGEENIENKLLNAGIVALINRDSNVFRMMVDARGIEREALEEALSVIVKNEGQDCFEENDSDLQNIGLLNDFLGFETSAVEFIVDTYKTESSEAFGKFIKGFSTAATTSATIGVNYLNAAETMKQFENVTEAQKELLKETVLSHSEDSPLLCGDWDNVYKAAQNVDERIRSEYKNGFEAAYSTMQNTAYSFLEGASGNNPVTLVWNGLVFISKVFAAGAIEKKTQLYNAYNSSMIQLIANELLVDSVSDLYYNDYLYSNSTSQYNHLKQMKYSLILQLKSTITTRQYLIKSGYLDETYAQEMKDAVRETAVLLNKVENCKIIPVGAEANVDEDLTWMETFVVQESASVTEETENSDNSINIYSNDMLTVSGTLTTEDYIINSNNKGTVYILNLDKPIVAELYDDFMGFNGETENIDSVQINDSAAESYKGKHIQVTGTVFFGHTGHHLRTIVLKDCIISEDTADSDSDNGIMAAYEAKLTEIYNNPSAYYDESDFSNMEENLFAIADITGDGIPELIVRFESTFMASMVVKVWTYDEISGEAVLGCVLNETAEFFEDGYILENASHNHSYGAAVWPHSVLKIRDNAEGYDVIYGAHSKDESICSQVGIDFPYEEDLDNDGIIYYVTFEDTETEPYTEEEYNSVVRQYIPSNKKLDIVYEYATLNNINNIN